MAVTIPPNIVYANTLVKWLTEILHYKYSEACLNRTLNKLESCVNLTLNKVRNDLIRFDLIYCA
jgi:hypothetical protein